MMSDHRDVREHELHAAVRANDVERVTLLLDNGADVNARASNNNTALHLAAELGYGAVVGALLKSPGININIKNDDDETAIQIANAKDAEHRVNLRRMMELPENKDKPLFKSDSAFYVISQMILNHKRLAYHASDNMADQDAKSNDRDAARKNPFLKLIRKITRVDVNYGLMNLSDILKCIIKENYSPSKSGEAYNSITPEFQRINNLLFFVNSCLSLVNIGIRVLVDKISNKITGNAQGRPLITSIIKGVLTTPISLVQLVVGGVAEAINWAGQFVASKISGKPITKDAKNANDNYDAGSSIYKKKNQNVKPAAVVNQSSKRNAFKAFFDSKKERASLKSQRQSLAVEMEEIDQLRPKQ